MRGAAADDQRIKVQSAGAQRFDHLASAIGQTAQACDIELDQARDVALKAEAGDHGAGVGIGVRRAIAKKLGHHMDVAGQCRNRAQRMAVVGDRHVLEKR